LVASCGGVIREEDIFEYLIEFTIPVGGRGRLGEVFTITEDWRKGGTGRTEIFIHQDIDVARHQ